MQITERKAAMSTPEAKKQHMLEQISTLVKNADGSNRSGLLKLKRQILEISDQTDTERIRELQEKVKAAQDFQKQSRNGTRFSRAAPLVDGEGELLTSAQLIKLNGR